MAAPPGTLKPSFVLVRPRNNWHMVQTFCLKVHLGDGVHQSLRFWLQSLAFRQGVVAYAIRELVTPGGERELYALLTLDAPRDRNTYVERVRTELVQLAVPVVVEEMQALDRRLQRRLNWGDVCATHETVSAAAAQADEGELAQIWPQAAGLLQSKALALCDLPALYAVSQDAPRLGDCVHCFNTEQRLMGRADRVLRGIGALIAAKVEGPCMRQGTDPFYKHQGPFTRCTKIEEKDGKEVDTGCGLVLCMLCARKSDEAAEEDEVALSLGSLAGALPDLPGEFFHLPGTALQFFVWDLHNWSDEDKLAWLKHELPARVDLPTFAAKFLDLFGDKLRGTGPQQRKALQLYKAFKDDPSLPECKTKLSGADRGDFERVWDPNAAAYCRTCGKKARIHKLFASYCSQDCLQDGCVRVCKYCEAVLDNDHPFCSACKRGVPKFGPIRVQDPALARSLQRQQDMMKMAQRDWASTLVPKSSLPSAAKKQRRY